MQNYWSKFHQTTTHIENLNETINKHIELKTKNKTGGTAQRISRSLSGENLLQHKKEHFSIKIVFLY